LQASKAFFALSYAATPVVIDHRIPPG